MKATKVTRYQSEDGNIYDTKSDAAEGDAKHAIYALQITDDDDLIIALFENLRALSKIHAAYEKARKEPRRSGSKKPKQHQASMEVQSEIDPTS